MARNKNRYAYLELAILRDSPLLQALLVDATASGKPPAQVAVQRLADYYRAGSPPGAAQTSLISRASQPTTPLTPSSISAQETSARISLASEPFGLLARAREEKEMEYQAEQARANAMAALAALDSWEPD